MLNIHRSEKKGKKTISTKHKKKQYIYIYIYMHTHTHIWMDGSLFIAHGNKDKAILTHVLRRR